ncbi:MAG: PhoH family protein [Saccharofermentans sp.]|nr:PhoH family protein [Saccharofermentans sp.]
MSERIENISASDLTVVNYFSRISGKLDVQLEISGNDIVIEGSDGLARLRARNCIEAIIELSKEDEIDILLVDYLIYLAQIGKIEEFMAMGDDVFYTTPHGRPVKAKTLGQRFYVDSLRRSELVICAGPAGTGKTFLGVAMAVKAYRNKEVSRIILTRPAIEAGERLGFLPGDIEEKVNPYMRPIYDALQALLGDELFERLYEKGIIEVSPLAFMRGRNLDDCFVLLDEAQNTTIEQMKMFLTRLGLNCRACVCGDFTQIDLPRGTESGLRDAMKVLEGIEGVSLVTLSGSDIVRNSLVSRIVAAYDKRDKEKRYE